MPLVTKAGWRHFAWIICVASVVRAAALLAMHDSLTADPDAYREIARGLATHNTFGIVHLDPVSGAETASPTAFRPPLYPWLLSLITRPDGSVSNVAVGLLHWFLGVASIGGTYVVCRNLIFPNEQPEPEPHTETTRYTEVQPQTAFPVSAEPYPPADDHAVSAPHRLHAASALAAILVAIDPLLLQSSALVMTETCAVALVVLSLWLWLKTVKAIEQGGPHLRYSLLLGLSFGIAFLCRPTFILWPLLSCFALALWAVYQKNSQPFRAAVATLFIVSLVVAAWTTRNWVQMGKPIWATSHGGYTLLLGNNPPFYEHMRTTGASRVPFWRNVWEPDFFFERWEQRQVADPRTASFWDPAVPVARQDSWQAASGELAEDRLAYETAVASIQRDKFGFLLACRWRWERLWGPLPLQTGDRPSASLWAIGVFYSVVLVLVFIGIWRLGRSLLTPRWAAAAALWVSIASVHTIYWTDMRMRAPAVPVLSILAAASIGSRRATISKNRVIRSTNPADSS